MKHEFTYPSAGQGEIHACKWLPDGDIRAVVQLVHGIAEHTGRYEAFAEYLNSLGIVVVAEDHMGHGKSIGSEGIQGYFHGGWFTAVEDTVTLTKSTMQEYPGIPYVLFGHSMGSFMARTILAKYSGLGLSGCVICGTAWQPSALLKVGLPACRLVCTLAGETKPSNFLNGMVFGGYNKRVEHPKTPFDWLSRDRASVEEYSLDPLCGFTASAGLLRDMMLGIQYIQRPESLNAMNKEMPVLFVAGGDDPVGNYGKGVDEAFQAFIRAGMGSVKKKIYPLCRHEILNEINRDEVFRDISGWILEIIQ